MGESPDSVVAVHLQTGLKPDRTSSGLPFTTGRVLRAVGLKGQRSLFLIKHLQSQPPLFSHFYPFYSCVCHIYFLFSIIYIEIKNHVIRNTATLNHILYMTQSIISTALAFLVLLFISRNSRYSQEGVVGVSVPDEQLLIRWDRLEKCTMIKNTTFFTYQNVLDAKNVYFLCVLRCTLQPTGGDTSPHRFYTCI